jgi:hypothetical protein
MRGVAACGIRALRSEDDCGSWGARFASGLDLARVSGVALTAVVVPWREGWFPAGGECEEAFCE